MPAVSVWQLVEGKSTERYMKSHLENMFYRSSPNKNDFLGTNFIILIQTCVLDENISSELSNMQDLAQVFQRI